MKLPPACLLSVAMALATSASGQGTIYLSNLNQPSGGSVAVASDSWLAGFIRTGTNPGGHEMNSVRLTMNAALGSPSGFRVMLYGANGLLPGNSLGSLAGSEPTADGVFTYAASGISLLPSAYYFIVLTAANELAQGSYQWSVANTPAHTAADGWFLSSGFYGSSDGSSWTFTRPYPFQLAVEATGIPEPSMPAVFGMGLVALAFRCSKRIEKFSSARGEG